LAGAVIARQIVAVYPQWWMKTLYTDSNAHLGFNEYGMRSAEAIEKHWCLVFMASSLWHLTCLPTGPDRAKGLTQTIGDACRQQGRALPQKLLVVVHEQLSHGATADQVFAQIFATQQGIVFA
jgi:hypothetical protein